MRYRYDILFYFLSDLWANHIADSQASFQVLIQHDGNMMNKPRVIIAS